MARKRTHYRQGIRPKFPGMNFRSSWEYNFALILQYLDIPFLYEPKRFYFDHVATSYLPDFMLAKDNPWNSTWIEIKGMWKKGDKKKIMCFNAEYPKQTLHVIASKEYKELAKKYSKLIPEWEK